MVTWLFILSLLSSVLGMATIPVDKTMGTSLMVVASILLVGTLSLNVLTEILKNLKK